jgi:hypothetical protein
MKFKAKKRFESALRMPPLKHDPDPRKSKAIAWLVAQPDVRTAIWDRIRQDGTIAFDAATGTWAGPDHSKGTFPEPENLIEIAMDAIDPVEWAAVMLTKVGRPGITVGEAQNQIRAIVRHAIEAAKAPPPAGRKEWEF